MRFAALLLIGILIGIFIFFSGCTQNQLPASCAASTGGAARDSCVYREAVLAQEPFRCYNIGKADLRSACLDDSTNEAAKKKIKQQAAPKPPPKVELNSTQNGTPGQNRTQAAQQYSECYRTTVPDVRDACLQGLAIDRRDISICSIISSEEFRRECVVNIAQLIRNPQICAVFSQAGQAAERDLCNTYAKAGEMQ